MKILIDECIDQKLRLLFAGHDCQTAAYAKLAGLKNGVLLNAAESAGFELMITTDQEIPYQQNLGHRRIAIFILCAPTNRPSGPEPLGTRCDACNGVHHTWSSAPEQMRTPSQSGRTDLLAGLGGMQNRWAYRTIEPQILDVVTTQGRCRGRRLKTRTT